MGADLYLMHRNLNHDEMVDPKTGNIVKCKRVPLDSSSNAEEHSGLDPMSKEDYDRTIGKLKNKKKEIPLETSMDDAFNRYTPEDNGGDYSKSVTYSAGTNPNLAQKMREKSKANLDKNQTYSITLKQIEDAASKGLFQIKLEFVGESGPLNSIDYYKMLFPDFTISAKGKLLIISWE